MSPNSWIAVAVIFAVGLLLFGIGSSMLRSLRVEESAQPRVTWPQLVDESLGEADAQLRLDMIERLSIVGTEWSRAVLERARDEDPDASVRSAIEAALQRVRHPQMSKARG